MKVHILDTTNGALVPATIGPAELADMPLKMDGWNFNWRQLHRAKGAKFYQLTLEGNGTTEGMMMLSLLSGEMMYLDNLEVAPHNLGRNGHYDHVAGCLIAFACRQSFLEGRGNYTGYLSFDSKTELIGLYQERYGATHAIWQKMFFDPMAGRALIEKYLEQKK